MAAAPTTPQEFLQLLARSQLVPRERLEAYPRGGGGSGNGGGPLPADAAGLAERMQRDGLLTAFQAKQLLAGRWRGFFLGAYRILEPLASGGMSRVLLA